MKTSALLLLLSLLFFQAATQDRFPIDPYALESVNTLINKALQEKTVPSIAIAIARNGKIIYEEALGYANKKKGTKAGIHSAYQLASATKPFTATAILLLHERGLIHIDSPVTKYLPELDIKKANPRFSTPTVRQVLNHTSGLGTYFDIGYADERYDFDDFDAGWKRYGTVFFEPGMVNEYSNLGYGLLSRIIEKVSGKSYANFMYKEIFAPLGLTDTKVDVPEKSAVKYDQDGTELPAVRNNTVGAGNIYASVHDLLRFGMFHLNARTHGSSLLNSGSVRLMTDYNDSTALYSMYHNAFYGLGWYRQAEKDSAGVIWHEGGMPGASSMLKLYPKEGITIAVITNTYNPAFIREITDKLSQIVAPNGPATPLNEMADYRYYTADPSFKGTWDGYISVEDQKIPASMTIDEKQIVLDYSDLTLKSFLTGNQPLPHKTVLLYGMVNKNYFIGTTTGVLPASHLRRELGHLMVLKLLKRDESLTGFVTIFAADKREYYAYPFFIELKKK